MIDETREPPEETRPQRRPRPVAPIRRAGKARRKRRAGTVSKSMKRPLIERVALRAERLYLYNGNIVASLKHALAELKAAIREAK